MTITAKFPGRCPKCEQPIPVGAQIDWAKGRKATHVTCGDVAAAPAPALDMSRQAIAARNRAHFAGSGRCRTRGCSAQAGPGGYCSDCAFDEFDQ